MREQNVRVAVDNLTDLGTSTTYWKDGYFKGSLMVVQILELVIISSQIQVQVY